MATSLVNRTWIIGGVAAVLAVALGIWGYGAYRTHELRKTVSALLVESGGRLRASLEIETGPGPIDRKKAAAQCEEFAVATEKSMAQLKRVDASRDVFLADDADGLLLSTREILRRRATSHRFYLLHDDSLAGLMDHMRADNRTATWVKQAVRAKERAERDFRDYQLAVAAYATLLASFPTTQKKLASRVDPAALIDEGLIARARERALESARKSGEEMEAARKLLAPR